MKKCLNIKPKKLQIFFYLLPLVLSAKLFAQDNIAVIKAGSLPNASQVQRVLSAGLVSDVVLFSLAPEKMIGTASQDLDKPNKKYLSKQIKDIPFTGKLAGKGSTYPIEKLIASKPDLIVDVGNVSKTYVATAEKVQQQTNIPFVLIEGVFSKTDQQIRTLAEILGKSEKGEQLAQFTQKVLQKTQGITAISFYFARNASGLETGLKGSIHTEVIEWLGAKNVAEVADNHGIVTVSMEQLLQWQPDVILTQNTAFYDSLKQSALWQNLNAVKQGRFYLVPNAPFGWLDAPPSVNRLLGAIWLSHKLAPQKLSQAEAVSLIQEYFSLFYQYPLSEVEAVKFLN